MKSYLRFLSRNKLYTAIEVVGLSVALAFVIVLSSYIVDDMSVNKALKNTDDIYLCHTAGSVVTNSNLPEIYSTIPDISESCSVAPVYGDAKRLYTGITCARHADQEVHVATIAGSSNFFEFFTFPLLAGNPKEALENEYSVIISDELANIFFPEGDALGKVINLFEENALKGFYPDIADLDIDLTVTGVFAPFPKTIFNEPDIIINIDLYQKLMQTLFQEMLQFGQLNFIRTRENTDIEATSQLLNTEYRKYLKLIHGPQYNYNEEVLLTQFERIRELDSGEINEIGTYFNNIRNKKLFNIYLLMCIFLTIVAMLDYVVLTIAFSRFRIKEIATRQLLGTDRKGIIGRCFAEAFTLLMVSCTFAVLIALAFKEPIGQILGTDIHPMKYLSEYMILAGMILVMVALSGAVPSIILSSYQAINVIKGEARYKDKIVFSKIFIGIAGLLSIGALSICFGITRQTRHLINQPWGYETDNIVFIQFLDKGMNTYQDELEAQSYVSKVGRFNNMPVYPEMTMIADKTGEVKDEVRVIAGDRTYFDILGVEFLEEFSEPNSTENLYLCQSTYENIGELLYNNTLFSWQGALPVCGTVSDMKLGDVTEDTAGKITGIRVLKDFSTTLSIGEQLCVQVDRNVADRMKRIWDFYYSKGYDTDMMGVISLQEIHSQQVQEEKNMLMLLAGFSVICILMTIMTIVGLSSYHAKTGEKDNAVRNVFGCSKGEIVRKMVLNFTLPIIISAFFAIPAAYTVIDRWLEGYVIRTENSPLIYIGAFATVLGVTLIAIGIQALRLIRTNPAEALKKE